MYGLTILASFFFCFFLEVILRARHQNEGKSPTHVHHTHTHTHIKAFGWLNLVGDGVHNFMDGIGLAGAFQVSTAMGMATMICICFHEIPQELSDFGVLISAGFSVRQALVFNLLSAGFAVLGCFLGLLLNTGGLTQQLGFIVNEKALVCITAGSFLYIVASMIPELMSHMFSKKRRFRNENPTMNAVICATGIGIGIGLMLFIGFAEHKIIDFFSK
jgi:zinc transporter ZupT